MKRILLSALGAMLLTSAVADDTIQALEEIVKIRQEMLQQGSALYESGRITTTELNQRRIDLIGAQIDLESERSNTDKVVGLLSEMIQLQEQKLKELTVQYQQKMGTFTEVSEQRIQVLRTKVRLTKARARLAESNDKAE